MANKSNESLSVFHFFIAAIIVYSLIHSVYQVEIMRGMEKKIDNLIEEKKKVLYEK